MMNNKQLQNLLDPIVDEYNNLSFIEEDPISIPHSFSRKQDIEIMGFWAAMLAWGQRKTIINKAKELISLMDGVPYEFIMQHQPSDLKRLESFKHRTFQYTDTLYFVDFFQRHFSSNKSLECAFGDQSMSTKDRITHFHEYFFDSDNAPHRTRKHVSTPVRGSACKRLNMFLRWMVRSDDRGVDFGLWRTFSPADIMIPLDVHVYNVAHQLGLIKREKSDWRTVEELTSNLRQLDPKDPVKYDFALFSIGVEKRNPLG